MQAEFVLRNRPPWTRMLRAALVMVGIAGASAFMAPSPALPGLRAATGRSTHRSLAASPIRGPRVFPSLRMSASADPAATGQKGSVTENPQFALLFDCDGVIVLTEELHRLAYNGAFEDFDVKVNGVPVVWDVEYYDVLQNTVGGGKPKMRWHFNNKGGWPTSKMGGVPANEVEETALIDALQDKKTEIYKKIVTEVAKARPGVLEMIDEVSARKDIAKGICSAATRGGFDQVVNSIVGKDRLARLDLVLAGDDVPRKKPDPIIYELAGQSVGLPPEKCIVVEDSLVGLRAAKGAGMRCIITYTDSTKDCDFYAEGADAVVPDFSKVTLSDIFDPLFAGETEILKDIRDPPK